MTGVGKGLIVTDAMLLETAHPDAVIVSVTVMEPVGPDPHVIVAAFVLAPAVITPPEIVHK
jgi:hypothetical protein